MSKIRINELARELEVKPGVIIDALPELGVSDKKTHSSSLDDDVVAQLRERLAPGSTAPPRYVPPPDDDEPGMFDSLARMPAPRPEPEPPAPSPAPEPPPAPVVATPEPQLAPTPVPAEKPTIPPVAAAPVTAEDRPRPVQPLRPPLAGSKPAVPVTPPVVRATPTQPPPASAPAPAAPPPQAAALPKPRPGSVIPAPAAPSAPTPRPGQILSGPRQPIPQDVVRPTLPGAPAPAPQRPPRPAQQPSAAPGPGAPRPQQPPPPQTRSVPLAGQPAPRPVVPPRPDLVARLQQQTQQRSGPGQPAAPRPGAPQQARPGAPGQPGNYRGPVRPGQPVMRGPGMGPTQPGAPGRPPRRGMHPTTPLPTEPQPAPTDTRRHATKPRTRPAADREFQEGKLRPVARHREEQVQAVNKEITIGEGITVKELAEKLGIKGGLVVKKLLDKKIFATINQTLDVKLAEEIASYFGAAASHMTFEEEATWEVELAEESADQVTRPPVVTVMGHVDHGKTSLLDSIRESDVAAHEHGGITQHIGASVVQHNGSRIVFIDTPGHEAFTRMRARGAKVTDIVILVVAADDGVMPQTIEAIDHARAAKVPIIVAINKVDKPDAQPDRIKQQLSDRGLLAEDWGGDVVMVPVSAKTRQNIPGLLEYVQLVAEVQNLKANHARPAVCTVLEAKLDRGRGPVATVLVRNGTLRVGDNFICGTVFSRVRALVSDHGEMLKEAGPSTPVEILGLEALPEVGETLQVVTDTAKAKQIVMFREHKAREVALAKSNRVSLETLHQQLKEGEVKELNVIVKADVGGSAEVLGETLQKLSNDKVRIKVIHSGVGAITETDVLLASASEAIVIGFNVRPERTAAAIAEQEKVDIRLHTIIYDLTQEIKKAMVGLLEPVYKEVYRGRAEVRETFRISKVGQVAGSYVLDGVVARNSEVRVLRDNVVIHTGRIEGLRRFKDDVSEVKTGFECGISIANFNDIKPRDVLEVFSTERIAHSME